VGESDGRFTEEDRGRLIRWLLQELTEAADGITRSAGEVGWTDGGWTEFAAACGELRRATEVWLSDAEQRIRTKGTGTA